MFLTTKAWRRWSSLSVHWVFVLVRARWLFPAFISPRMLSREDSLNPLPIFSSLLSTPLVFWGVISQVILLISLPGGSTSSSWCCWAVQPVLWYFGCLLVTIWLFCIFMLPFMGSSLVLFCPCHPFVVVKFPKLRSLAKDTPPLIWLLLVALLLWFLLVVLLSTRERLPITTPSLVLFLPWLWLVLPVMRFQETLLLVGDWSSFDIHTYKHPKLDSTRFTYKCTCYYCSSSNLLIYNRLSQNDSLTVLHLSITVNIFVSFIIGSSSGSFVFIDSFKSFTTLLLLLSFSCLSGCFFF